MENLHQVRTPLVVALNNLQHGTTFPFDISHTGEGFISYRTHCQSDWASLKKKKEAGKNFIRYKDKVIKNSKNHHSFGLTSLEEQQAHKMPQVGIMLDKCETETLRKPVKSSLLYWHDNGNKDCKYSFIYLLSWKGCKSPFLSLWKTCYTCRPVSAERRRNALVQKN